MQFERRQFAGMPLDILVGHPEHELLFVAAQVAEASGLKDGTKHLRRMAARLPHMRVSEALGVNLTLMRPETVHAPTWHKMFLFPESSVYAMLLRGHAPQSEPFRKWVTDEVLPSLRKSGTYTMPGAPEPSLPTIPEFTGSPPTAAPKDLLNCRINIP